MKSLGWAASALLLAAVAVAPAPASATLYDWTLNAGGGLKGSGTLTTGTTAGSGFDIVGLTGTIGGVPVALLGGQPGAQTTSPSGAFLFDNVVFPSSDPVFDVSGLLFTIGGDEGNIWGNGAAGSYSYWTHNGSSYDYSNGSASFALTPAPEPASLAVLGVGLLGLTWFRHCPV